MSGRRPPRRQAPRRRPVAAQPPAPAPRPQRRPGARVEDPHRRTFAILGALVVAAGLVIGGFVLVTRGGDTGTTACATTTGAWTGAGGGPDHLGSRPLAGKPPAEPWTPVWRTPAGGGLTAPPAADGAMVYTGDAHGALVALDAGSGTVAWTSPGDTADSGPVHVAPALDGCSAVVVTTTASGGVVRAVDLQTHARRFGQGTTEPPHDSPEIVRGVAVTGAAAGGQYRVDGIGLLDGGRRFSLRLPAGVLSSPAITGDDVVVGTVGGSVVDGRIAADGASLSQRWTTELGGIAAAGPVVTARGILVAAGDGRVSLLATGDGHELWQADAGGAVDVLPVAAGTTDIVAARTGRVTAYDAATGAVRWRVETGAVIPGMALAGRELVLPLADGTVRMLDAASGAELVSWDAGSPPVGQPALVGTRVVITTADGRVAALPLLAAG